ncbi:DUF362 domain-containing protein [Patescibacteria group bacterium]|nr:DUF362 domain-containing protein [Patescibacteria group bacterium]
MLTKVILETGDQRRQVVNKAVEALGDDFFNYCQEADTILIKVNLVHHEYQLASTHVDAVRGVLDVIRSCSQTKVLIGDASYHGTKAAFRNFGYERLHDGYSDIELVDLNDDDYVDGYTLHADGSKNPIRRSKAAVDADFKISLTPMKMHRDTAVSLSVKNWSVGTWLVPSRISANGRVWARWPWLDEESPWAHHASIMELYRQVPCEVAIVDGMMAMEGDGPTRGTAVPLGLALAGTDPVAVDAVAATLMGVDPSDIGHLALCAQEGLGIVDLAKIDVPPMLMHENVRQFERPRYFEDRLRAWKTSAPQLTPNP